MAADPNAGDQIGEPGMGFGLCEEVVAYPINRVGGGSAPEIWALEDRYYDDGTAPWERQPTAPTADALTDLACWEDWLEISTSSYPASKVWANSSAIGLVRSRAVSSDDP